MPRPSWLGGGKAAGPAPNRNVTANNAAANAEFPGNAISNTKYNALSFVPLNIKEQFGRAMNQYFLIIACLQLVKEITPVNPLTTWLPLIVIFGVTAVKELLDDLGRKRADAIANARPYSVLRGGRLTSLPSRDIRVGDVVRLAANEEVPADMVLLSSSDAGGNCFIQTTNLDGESNLKVRTAVPATRGLTTPEALAAFAGLVECAAPNEHIYKFDSQLRVGAAVVALTSTQLLLQATHVRNTDWVYGLVVYTGNQTKFGCNKRTPPTKYTLTDSFINTVSACIFGVQLALVLIFGGVGDGWQDGTGRSMWPLSIVPPFPGYDFLIVPARFLLLNSTMIPISLKLTMDLCKLCYAKFINADVGLVDPSTGTGAKSNSTALSEDLGQVRYVLTDKTGTLTENRMVLKVATVGGVQYGDGGLVLASATEGIAIPGTAAVVQGALPPSLREAAATGMMADPRLYELAAGQRKAAGSVGPGAVAVPPGPSAVAGLEFLRCLALNNDVVPSEAAPGALRPTYKASSPDEEALVAAAASYGVVLQNREGDNVSITAFGEAEHWLQLACFEFNSDRKRMSVIVRHKASGVLRLYCKGADDMLMARLAAGQPAARVVQAQIDRYASAGLRTLVMSYRDLNEAEYQDFSVAYEAAAAAMSGREEAKEAVYTRMEAGLTLLGATAIEDKLQDGVPETIGLLKQAGVSFWMLTGDKFSTALTIARTCNLKPGGNNLIEIEGESGAAVAASLDKAWADAVRLGHGPRYTIPLKGWRGFAHRVSCGRFYRGSGVTGAVVRDVSDLPHSSDRRSSGAVVPAAAVGGPEIGAPHVAPTGGAAAAAGNSGTSPRRGAPGDPPPYTVIVRGATLDVALTAPHRQRLGAICMSADSVICCRVTPKQKAELVKLVRETGALTLAIGDGGNDVAMIQEAAVGVGIRGKEGLQAARASDYQVPLFRALQRLLLVHGRFSYHRTAIVAYYSFYKSFLFCVMQIVYGFLSGFAGVSLFNSLCVAAYNAVLFVPIVYFMLDKDITQHTALTQPVAYRTGNERTELTGRRMVLWFLRGLWQAIAHVLIAAGAVKLGASADYESLGLVVFFIYMLTQDFTMLMTLRRVTIYNAVSIFGMHGLALLVAFLCNITPAFRSFIDTGSLTHVLGDPVFWLLQPLLVIICIGPVEAWRVLRATYTDTFEGRLAALDRRNEAVGWGDRGHRAKDKEGTIYGTGAYTAPGAGAAPGGGGSSSGGSGGVGGLGSLNGDPGAPAASSAANATILAALGAAPASATSNVVLNPVGPAATGSSAAAVAPSSNGGLRSPVLTHTAPSVAVANPINVLAIGRVNSVPCGIAPSPSTLGGAAGGQSVSPLPTASMPGTAAKAGPPAFNPASSASQPQHHPQACGVADSSTSTSILSDGAAAAPPPQPQASSSLLHPGTGPDAVTPRPLTLSHSMSQSCLPTAPAAAGAVPTVLPTPVPSARPTLLSSKRRLPALSSGSAAAAGSPWPAAPPAAALPPSGAPLQGYSSAASSENYYSSSEEAAPPVGSSYPQPPAATALPLGPFSTTPYEQYDDSSSNFSPAGVHLSSNDAAASQPYAGWPAPAPGPSAQHEGGAGPSVSHAGPVATHVGGGVGSSGSDFGAYVGPSRAHMTGIIASARYAFGVSGPGASAGAASAGSSARSGGGGVDIELPLVSAAVAGQPNTFLAVITPRGSSRALDVGAMPPPPPPAGSDEPDPMAEAARYSTSLPGPSGASSRSLVAPSLLEAAASGAAGSFRRLQVPSAESEASTGGLTAYSEGSGITTMTASGEDAPLIVGLTGSAAGANNSSYSIGSAATVASASPGLTGCAASAAVMTVGHVHGRAAENWSGLADDSDADDYIDSSDEDGGFDDRTTDPAARLSAIPSPAYSVGDASVSRPTSGVAPAALLGLQQAVLDPSNGATFTAATGSRASGVPRGAGVGKDPLTMPSPLPAPSLKTAQSFYSGAGSAIPVALGDDPYYAGSPGSKSSGSGGGGGMAGLALPAALYAQLAGAKGGQRASLTSAAPDSPGSPGSGASSGPGPATVTVDNPLASRRFFAARP